MCDTPLPAVVEAHGNYLAIFSRLFKSSLPDPQVEFSLDGFDVVKKQEYPPLDAGYDGIVISGSGNFFSVIIFKEHAYWNEAASAYDDVPWISRLISYIKSLAETRPEVKIIGGLFDAFHFTCLMFMIRDMLRSAGSCACFGGRVCPEQWHMGSWRIRN